MNYSGSRKADRVGIIFKLFIMLKKDLNQFRLEKNGSKMILGGIKSSLSDASGTFYKTYHGDDWWADYVD